MSLVQILLVNLKHSNAISQAFACKVPSHRIPSSTSTQSLILNDIDCEQSSDNRCQNGLTDDDLGQRANDLLRCIARFTR